MFSKKERQLLVYIFEDKDVYPLFGLKPQLETLKEAYLDPVFENSRKKREILQSQMAYKRKLKHCIRKKVLQAKFDLELYNKVKRRLDKL